jgi:hypothetical protein
MRLTGMRVSVGLQLVTYSSAFAPRAVPPRSPSRLQNSLRDLVLRADQPPPTPAPLPERTMAPATTSSASITETEVRALFELWNAALATGDARIVADRYIRAPMLLPTVSDRPRTGERLAASRESAACVPSRAPRSHVPALAGQTSSPSRITSRPSS